MAKERTIGVIVLIVLLSLSSYVGQIPFSLISEQGIKEGFPTTFRVNGKTGTRFDIPYEHRRVMFNLEIMNPGNDDLICLHLDRNFEDMNLFRNGRMILKEDSTEFNRIFSRYTLHRWDIEEGTYQVQVDKKLTSGRIYCKVGNQRLELNLLPPSFWQLPSVFQFLRGE